MKTAKVPAGEPSSSSRRAQPVRQTRTNPPRTHSGLNRLSSRESLSGTNATEQPIDIFPGVTHFADAITALPKELVRHFTLLKEVDAKIFAPQEALFQLVQAALESSPQEPAQLASSTIAPASAPMSTQNSSSGIVANGTTGAPASANGSSATSVYDDSNLARRHLFRQTALKIQEMLVSLEEKNHVISTANDALQKQSTRIDNIWPHLEGEFSEEAKWGSDSHWAYPENRAARALNSQAERTRREGAANLSAAAQFVAEEAAAARSEARKQAVAAKKSQRNTHTHDSEHDDHDGKGKGESSKKQSHSKRKTAANAANAESPANVGLGIIGQTTASSTPAPKRRKVDKNANGGTPTERAMAAVFSNGKNSKTKASESPRATPAPEQPAPKKRKALPNSTGQTKKRTGPGQTPSATSSPVIGALPDNTKPPRASPAPSVSGRPQTSRARQGSLASNADNSRQRPPSAAANRPNGGSAPPPIEIPTHNNGSRAPGNDTSKTQMEPPSATAKSEPVRQQSERAATPQSAGGQKKEGSVKPTDEVEARKETTPSVPLSVSTQQVTTTKSGRASKPSTPAIGSFPDTPTGNGNNNNNNNHNNNGNNGNNSRARPSRNSETPAVPKRSHKKGASAAHAAAVQKALAQSKADDESNSMQEDDNDGIDPNEETYCYCNQVSYGQMVACDGEHCKMEWFHLECVGLKVAPGKNVKWYCDDCKKQTPAPGKKINGR